MKIQFVGLVCVGFSVLVFVCFKPMWFMHLVVLFAVQYVVSPAAEIHAVNVACLVFLFPAHVPLEFGAGGGFLSVKHKIADFAIRLEPSLPNRYSFLADVLVLKIMKTIFKKSFPLLAFSST